MSTLAELAARLQSKSVEIDLKNRTAILVPTETIELPKQEQKQIIINAPLTQLDQIRQQIAQLSEQLQANTPGYESLLFHIHKTLKEQEEQAVLLTDEEVGVICAGLTKKKGIVIATSIARTSGNKTSNGKSLKDIALSDL